MTTRPSLAEIEVGLARAFPDLQITPVHLLHVGFGSIAVETAGGLVFRIARDPGTAHGHARELEVLPVLAPRLPVPIPRPRWRIEPGEIFPLGALGYPKLAGEPIAPEALAERERARLASDLAAFLAALHGFSVDEAHGLGLASWKSTRAAFRWERDDVLPVLEARLTPGEYRAVVAWWESFLADPALERFRPALRHGDPWYGNLLVDDSGRLAGVLDWEGIEVGDPAWDLAAQMYLGEGFVRTVLERYVELAGSADRGLGHRAGRLHELREFGGVRRAASISDEAELDDAVEKIRRSSILRD